MKIEAERTQPGSESAIPVDKEALEILNKTIRHNSQLKSIPKRLSKDIKLKELCEQTLKTDLQKFYVKLVEMQQPEPGKNWYLPHHPVVKPNEPGKVRRVANAAAKFRGQSLNSVGYLLRFHEKPVAFLPDIEGLFMQITIKHEDQSALCFLWPNKDQFTRLIFRATCSPFCAIFVMIRCAKAVIAIKNYFYRDDYVYSLPSIEKTIETITGLRIAFKKVAFAWKNLCQTRSPKVKM